MTFSRLVSDDRYEADLIEGRTVAVEGEAGLRAGDERIAHRPGEDALRPPTCLGDRLEPGVPHRSQATEHPLPGRPESDPSTLVYGPTMDIASINGVNLAFTDSGPVDGGRTVVFSHGLLMDHEMFEPQIAALAGQHRVITWDERAHGETRAPGPFSYWDSARDLTELLDHLGVDTAVLAGMSQGGFLSLRAALACPERI